MRRMRACFGGGGTSGRGNGGRVTEAYSRRGVPAPAAGAKAEVKGKPGCAGCPETA